MTKPPASRFYDTQRIRLEALATAIVALEQLGADRRPTDSIEGMQRQLSDACNPTIASYYLAQAACRLFPKRDRAEIYRQYGIALAEVYRWQPAHEQDDAGQLPSLHAHPARRQV